MIELVLKNVTFWDRFVTFWNRFWEGDSFKMTLRDILSL